MPADQVRPRASQSGVDPLTDVEPGHMHSRFCNWYNSAGKNPVVQLSAPIQSDEADSKRLNEGQTIYLTIAILQLST